MRSTFSSGTQWSRRCRSSDRAKGTGNSDGRRDLAISSGTPRGCRSKALRGHIGERAHALRNRAKRRPRVSSEGPSSWVSLRVKCRAKSRHLILQTNFNSWADTPSANPAQSKDSPASGCSMDLD